MSRRPTTYVGIKVRIDELQRIYRHDLRGIQTEVSALSALLESVPPRDRAAVEADIETQTAELAKLKVEHQKLVYNNYSSTSEWVSAANDSDDSDDNDSTIYWKRSGNEIAARLIEKVVLPALNEELARR